MEKILTFLSGGVPGGFLLLALALIVVNLIFLFLKSSKLYTKERSLRGMLLYSVVVLMLYLASWLIFQSPKPQLRIVVLPTLNENKSFKVKPTSFEFAELFKQASVNNLKDKYLLHRWNWLYETIGSDSAAYWNLWEQVSSKTHPAVLIRSQKNADGITAVVYSDGDSAKFQAKSSLELLRKTDKVFGFFKAAYRLSDVIKPAIEFRLLLLQDDYNSCIERLAENRLPELIALRAEALARKGLKAPIDHEKAQYVAVRNPDLEEASRIFYSQINNKQDSPETAYWLGRISIYKQEYGKAEVFLKTALLGDPGNARIHLAMSYLHNDRLVDFGYANRAEILQRAVSLDPGFREGVYRLANEYYITGTGTESGMGTTRARQTIENFLQIRKNDLRIMSLLASIEMKLQYYDKALEIYTWIAVRQPDNSNAIYNLGVVHFMKKDYQKALQFFLEAIEMDENLDAYLYTGITYRMLGDDDKALKYYRERVRRKSGDNDIWAKEAMKGIRKILAESTSVLNAN